jgi:hypothetical protein
MKQNKKVDKIMLEIYRELYKNSTPAADFDELMENAELNQFGQKIIHYMDYKIEKEKFDEIVETKLKGSRLDEWYKRGIRFNIYLGCSPAYKYENDEK